MRWWLGVFLIAAIVGCGGGGGSSSVPSAPASTQPAMGTLSVKISFPSAGTTTSVKLRKAFSVASSTYGILFTVYPHGGNPATQAIVTSGDDLSPTSSACTTSGTSRTCTITLAAPVGTSNDLLAQTYDQVIPPNGTVPAGAHLLAAAGVPNVPVTAGTNNTVSFTLDPVLSTVHLLSTPAVVHAVLPVTSVAISVLGFDAGGNEILAGNYVDSNGNPVSVALSTTTNNNNAFTLTASPVTGSGQTASASFNGMATSTTAIQVSSAAPYASTLNINVLAPTVYRVADANLAGTPTPPGYMGITALNTAGEYYVFYDTPADTLDYLNGGSNGGPGTQIPSAQTPGSATTAGYAMQGSVVNDTSSNLIFTGGNFSMTQFSYIPSSPPPPRPQVAATCTPSGVGSCAPVGGIAFNTSNSNLYYGSGANLYWWAPNGTPVTWPTPVPPNPTPPPTAAWGGFTYDATNNRIWGVDTEAGGLVYMFDATSGSSTMESASLAGSPFDVTTYPGTLCAYVTVPGAKEVLDFATPLTDGATPAQTYTFSNAPEFITADSSQIWFTETNASGVVLGHIDPNTGTSAEFPLPSNAGGIAGPILLLGYGNAFAIVHYGGGSGGEVLLVIP